MNKIRKKVIFTLLFMCAMWINKQVYCAGYLYTLDNESKNTKDDKNITGYIEDESSVSVNSESYLKIQPAEFDFKSVSQILIEPTTNTILYENNADEKLLPASVTKVMTLLITMEQIDSGKLKYDDTITCSAKASKMGGSQIWFKENEKLSVDESLKAICLASANDVTVAVAEHIAGSEENFVKMMNEKAKSIGMNNTNFKNCHGLDEEGHYTTARDISIMSRELITKHPDILKYTSIWMDSLRGGTFGLTNTNKLIRFYDGATGLKTGSTSSALFNLSACATRNGTTFLSVVMRAPSSDIRLQETKQLLDFAFANYDVQTIFSKDNIVDKEIVEKSLGVNLDVGIAEDVTVLKNKATNIEVETNVIYDDGIIAPIEKGKKVGKVEIVNKITNEIIEQRDIIALNEVNRAKFEDYIKVLFKKLILAC